MLAAILNYYYHYYYYTVLIFHKQKVSFWILPEDLNGLFRHLHNGWITRFIPVNVKFHVFWLKKTWNRQQQGSEISAGDMKKGCSCRQKC